jgi:hypothetical protein
MLDMSTDSNWLARTRQRWKAYVGFACILGSGVFFVQMILGLHGHGTTHANYLAGIALGMCGIIWLGTSIVCRACGARVAWRLARTKSLNDWWPTLKALQSCPVCGARNGNSESGPAK